MQLTFRPQAKGDAKTLSLIEGQLFDCDLISYRSFRRFPDQRSIRSIVAELHDSIIAYVTVFYRSGSPTGRIYSIAVLADYRSQKIGTRLMELCEQDALSRDCRALRLEAKSQEASTISFYRHLGYEIYGESPRFYEDGSDAVLMRKPLVPPQTRLPRPNQDVRPRRKP